VSRWPSITEPELLRRMTMGEEEFGTFIGAVASQLGPRPCDAGAIAQALGYPWARPAGSYLLRDGAVATLAAMGRTERERAIGRFTSPAGGRLPALAIGSNAAPETLERKFAHFTTTAERQVLALTGRLHDFDVGVAAQPTMYGSMPATPFPSPGTAVAATLLWLTPAQLTQLAWSEITYRLGKLRTRFEIDGGATAVDEVLVFVSRFGSFCPCGEPAALAAIPAAGRGAPELSQAQLLEAAARLALGPAAGAETLVRAIFEEPAETLAKIAATVRRAALPFSSEAWTPFGPLGDAASGAV
jgi:hypothetical protein